MEQRIVLFTALNWGLGHATRLVPSVIKAKEKGDKVILAGYGNSGMYLQKQFPELPYYRLGGYSMRYASGKALIPILMAQIPLFYIGLVYEHFAVKRLIKRLRISHIVSDNRYGVFSLDTYNILISHQLRIAIPGKAKILSRFVNSILKYWIERFHECHVPDYLNFDESLSGSLSHNIKLKVPVLFIGPQSAVFTSPEESILITESYILVMLSGNEPQRSQMQLEMERHFFLSADKVVFIGGSSSPQNMSVCKTHFFEGCVNPGRVKSLVKNATRIIARAGYSTIMDIHLLGRGAELIPTPHQWEQEYLVSFLEGRYGFSQFNAT